MCERAIIAGAIELIDLSIKEFFGYLTEKFIP